jgi:large subunit ribosomal protein L25
MEQEFLFQAKTRSVIGKQVKALRRGGELPAILYGHHINPIPISLDYRDTVRVLPGVSSSQLIEVEVDGERHTALVREKQHDPVSGALLHVDFQVVSLTERLRAMVRIMLEGEAPAVKNFNGIVVTGQEELEVECLPGNLPNHLVVDITRLEEIGDAIYVRDIEIPPDVEVLTDLNELVVLITAQEAEPEPEEVEVEVTEAEPEVIERGKKEEEEEEEK